MGSTLILRVPEGPPVRADRFLAETLPDVSRRRVQAMLEEGRIRIGGHRVRKGDGLPGGAEIAIDIAAPAATTLAAEAEPAVPVLYEDPDLLALDKPAGRPGHALRVEDRGTVANFLAARYPETAAASDLPLEHGLVHRLDSGTSGVLLVARTRETWDALRGQFAARTVEKRYVALVAGTVDGPGEIALAIEPHPRSRRRVRVVAPGRDAAGARPALTRYRPLARYSGATLVEVEIPTGVRHQIRAHLAFLGHPVAGDPLYGGDGTPGVVRLLLHAAAIGITHPRTRGRLRVESPLPADFALALEGFRREG